MNTYPPPQHSFYSQQPSGVGRPGPPAPTPTPQPYLQQQHSYPLPPRNAPTPMRPPPLDTSFIYNNNNGSTHNGHYQQQQQQHYPHSQYPNHGNSTAYTNTPALTSRPQSSYYQTPPSSNDSHSNSNQDHVRSRRISVTTGENGWKVGGGGGGNRVSMNFQHQRSGDNSFHERRMRRQSTGATTIEPPITPAYTPGTTHRDSSYYGYFSQTHATMSPQEYVPPSNIPPPMSKRESFVGGFVLPTAYPPPQQQYPQTPHHHHHAQQLPSQTPHHSYQQLPSQTPHHSYQQLPPQTPHHPSQPLPSQTPNPSQQLPRQQSLHQNQYYTPPQPQPQQGEYHHNNNNNNNTNHGYLPPQQHHRNQSTSANSYYHNDNYHNRATGEITPPSATPAAYSSTALPEDPSLADRAKSEKSVRSVKSNKSFKSVKSGGSTTTGETRQPPAKKRQISVKSVNVGLRVYIDVAPNETGHSLAEKIHKVATFSTRKIVSITTASGRRVPIDRKPLFDGWADIQSFENGEEWDVEWTSLEPSRIDRIFSRMIQVGDGTGEGGSTSNINAQQ